MAEEHAADTMIGRWILDQYHVVRVLAEGGMGCLYLAEQAAMDRYAAIKLLYPKISKKPRLRSRFRQEARAASRLAHPNIVTVYNFGELADGSLFLAMEYIEGVSLAELMGRQHVPLYHALDVCRQSAAALEHAHSKQVVHRDFKPENIMISRATDERYHAKVVDFGIARLTHDSSASDITQAGELIGTPRYLSPEQCRGDTASSASDQYALGLVLYELLAGRPPFEAESTLAYLRMHQHDSPAALSSIGGGELAPYDPVVLRMLSKIPEDRFAEMGQVREELERAHEQARRVYTSDTLDLELNVTRDEPTQTLKGPKILDSTPKVREVALLGDTSPLSEADFRNLQDGAYFHVPVRFVKHDGLGALQRAEEQPSLSIVGLPGGRWKEVWQQSQYKSLSPLLGYIDATPAKTALADAADSFRHLLIGSKPIEPVVLSVASGYVLLSERGGIERLYAGQPVQTLQISSLAAKSPAVDALLDAAREGGVRRQALHALAELAEEMLMNAVLHSPAAKNAASGADVRLPPGREAALSWVVGQRYIAVSVQDSFGALSARDVLSRVTGPALPAAVGSETPGAGMGLRIMSQAVRHLFFAISPGSWCEILALVEREVSDGGRTVSVLQDLGQPQVSLGNRLTMTHRREGDRGFVQLSGEINETSDLAAVFRLDGPLQLDLRGVERINSIGLRNIIDASRAGPNQRPIVAIRCSEAWVRQMNMIPALAEMAEIESILAPYYCARCQRESVEVLSAEQLRGSLPPDLCCGSCSEPMTFDGHPKEYFAFLEGSPEPAD